MAKIYIIQHLFISTFLLISISCFSQTCNIEGQTFDMNSNETLAGVTIQLLGTKYTTISDIDGHFKFEKLNPGKYKLQVSFISYESVSLFPVELTNSNSENVNISMKPVELSLSKEMETKILKDLISQNNTQNSI